jgi:hypothetical protein
MRTALPAPLSLSARLKRAFADPRLPILRRLASAEIAEIARLKARIRDLHYSNTRHYWQLRAARAELFGAPSPCPTPPAQIPATLLDQFTMNGKAEVEYNYLDATYPSNYPLIYTDAEIDHYISVISQNLARPSNQREWFIYGTLDEWVCDALKRYPLKDSSVVNMGSLTPWYESMLIHFGAKPTTIDYNPITLRTDRMQFMTIEQWEHERTLFDAGFSISSFEHDGLGMYGDPLDPDGDLKAMRKMKQKKLN